ncbi:mucin-17-like isoform X3 [Carcharodon carcharias]|nr:mucin-17-like isoform X3 [Carcharodon carcharias]
MFDLSSKEKPRSALGKLKDKVKGKKKHDKLMPESASAIVPSSVGQIISDDEFNEKETPEKRSKKGFFSKPKLHRSSLTKSNSSLSSQQSVKSMESVSSSTGAVTVSSPQTTAPPTGFYPLLNKTDDNPLLPKKMMHKRALSDEVGQVVAPEIKGLTPKTNPLSRSSLCINGSHIYSEEPSSKSSSGLFSDSSPLLHSAHDFVTKREHAPRPASIEGPEGRLWAAGGIGKVETRLIPPVITVANEEGALVPAADIQRQGEVGSTRGTKPVHAAVPIISTAEATKKNIPDETKKASIFPFGSDSKDCESRRSRTPSPVRKCSSMAERSKNDGWFVKDANHKPSLDVSPMVETSSDAPLFSPRLPLHPPPPVPPVPLLLPLSLCSSIHPVSLGSTTNTNLSTAAEGSLVPSSKPTTNPFFNALQNNPFFEDLLADQILKSPPFTSSSSSLTYGSQGVSDVSLPSPSTAESSGRDLHALPKPVAKEEIPASPPSAAPASTMTRTNISSFQRPGPTAPSAPLVTSDSAMWSAVFPSAGADAEVKGQVIHSCLVPTSAESVGDLNVATPSIGPRQMKMESGVEGECSSIFTQEVDHKTVEMGPSIPNTASIQPTNQGSSISFNISGLRANSKAKNNESSDIIEEETTTENANPLDLKTCSAQDTTHFPAIESPSQMESGSPPMIQNAVFSKEHEFVPELRNDLEPQTNSESLALHQEKITKEQKDLSNMEKSSLKEGGRGPRDIANKSEGWEHIGSSPLLVPEPEVTAGDNHGTTQAKSSKASIVPLFQDSHDNVHQVIFGKDDKRSHEGCQSIDRVGNKFQDVDVPCEGAGRSPETIAANNDIISESMVRLDSQFTQIGPPPPKPPRLLACADLGLEAEGNLVKEQQREKEMPFDPPATAVQLANLAEQQLDRRFEQKTSLVVSSPAVDEVNPDRTDPMSAESAAKESVDNIKPSNDVVTKGEAFCGTIELSVNERTGVEHYKTCLSALSAEGINTSIDADGNSNKLDVFQQTLTSSLIDVHQAKQPVKLQPALLKTTAGASSLETISLVDERPPTVLERPNANRKEETSLLWRDQNDQSELAFISAVEELPHKSSPIFPESLGSGELNTEISEEAGKGRGSSTLRDSEETLTRSMEVETLGSQSSKASCQSAGVRPVLRAEPVSLRTGRDQRAKGEEATLADHPAPDFCLSSTVQSDQGQFSEKADGAACNNQPSAQDDDQSVGDEKPMTDGCSSAISHAHSAACDYFFEEGLSFKELHLKAAPHALQVTNFTREQLAQPPLSNNPLAFSTPYPVAVTNSRVTDLPSPILFPSNVVPPSETTQPAVTPHHSLQSSGSKVPALTVLPRETQPAEMSFPQQRISPHPVKPISSTVHLTEKKSGLSGIGSTLSSGLEKLKNVTTGSISPIRSPAHEEQEAVKESKPTDPVARYYHLTHDELIKIILQQELELQKREEHVRDLEEYIDVVLVQVMEQKPSILQSVSEKMKDKMANK